MRRILKTFVSVWLILLCGSAIISAQINCCCGQPKKLDFPGFDFEFAPDPPPGWFIAYPAGSNMGPWDVTAGYVDHVEKTHYYNTGYGNPNGPSTFADLYGSPVTGSQAGILKYVLTGLTAGANYTFEFFYSKFDVPGTFKANIKIANGAWLNVTQSATNPGNIIWLKASFNFIAQSSVANLEFVDQSSSAYGVGLLIDDLSIYECPKDAQKPFVNNPPKDIEVECTQHIPPVPVLNITDNCDNNPIVTFNETVETPENCISKIRREWTITDACGNVTRQTQVVDVIDKNPPEFKILPTDITVSCIDDVKKIFDTWLINHANAIVQDACGPVSWRVIYDRIPDHKCDRIPVDFIAVDPCGNEHQETAYFSVANKGVKFTTPPVNKNYNSNIGVRDSLREWLKNNAYAIAIADCDSVIYSTNFKGDSSANPLKIVIYILDYCGHIDSASATFAYSGNTCCCGMETELFYPNLDFEAPPIAPPGGWFDYAAGDNYGGWNINSGSISVHSPTHLNLGAGNPNGSTQHMDLHGFNQGSATYTLTGLTPGNQYTISFWYAIHSFGASVSARLLINGGSLLNVSWNASNTGDVVWLSTMYSFIANSTIADMTFVGTGATPCCGMLIDDIHIFECPGDKEMPEVLNPPVDDEVACESDIPPAPTINVSDNCDANPKITFKEIRQNIDACTKKIIRTWEIEDACGNKSTEDQVIDVIDRDAPVFTTKPQDKIVYCNQDIQKEFSDWIKKNGFATAVDNCGSVSWKSNSDHLPGNSCDTIYTDFYASDACGLVSSEFAYFIVRDTAVPRFIVQAQNKNLDCGPGYRDSLRAWLINSGYSKNSGDCDTVYLSSNFNGDSTINPLRVVFYAKDPCGQVDSTSAIFNFKTASDTFGVFTFSCTYPKTTIDTFKYSANGCDSIVIVHNIRKESDSIYIQKNTCDSQQKLFDTLQLRNVAFCDSVVFLSYSLHVAPLTIIQFRDCNYSTFIRDTQKFSGQYCDSLVISEYIPLKKDSVIINQTTCDQSQEGILVLNLKNKLGCDSIVILDTKYTGQQSSFQTSFECGLAISYSDTVIIQTGNCDSVIITAHIALKTDTTLLQTHTCDPQKAGVFRTILQNQSGCDSLILQTIQLDPSDSIFISKSSCILSQTGIVRNQFSNRFGCDSIVITATSFISSDTLIIDSTTCIKSEERMDTLLLQGQLCDSLIITRYTYQNQDTQRLIIFTCDPLMVKSDTQYISNARCKDVVIRKTLFVPSDTNVLNLITCKPYESATDTLKLSNAAGCDSLIFISRQFIPRKIFLSIDSISCDGKNDGTVSINNFFAYQQPVELIINNTIIGSDNFANNLSAGQYKISVRDSGGCVSDTISFELLNPSPFTTELGPDILADLNEELKLNLSLNKSPAFIYWFPQDLSSCIHCPEINIKAEKEEWIYTLSIDERGCESRDSIQIRIRESLHVYAPNVFSINGDNINDHFYLIGDDQLHIELFEIYDRWGEMLFNASNIPLNHPEYGWNGYFKNQKMNPGVYVYYARVVFPNGEIKILKGDVTLIR
jgi:gliding motility-associated-like protein